MRCGSCHFPCGKGDNILGKYQLLDRHLPKISLQPSLFPIGSMAELFISTFF
jgi:hypothetical protein